MNIRKLISAALLISLITVAVPTPLDQNIQAISSEELINGSLIVPVTFFGLTALTIAGKIFSSLCIDSSKCPHAEQETKERQATLTNVGALTAYFTLITGAAWLSAWGYHMGKIK